jgi:hypothetical protein
MLIGNGFSMKYDLDLPLSRAPVRALVVDSARWTNAMLGHLPANPSKGCFAK